MKTTTCKPDDQKIPLVSRFIEERRYLKNVTTSTLAWYQNKFRAFSGAFDSKQTINQRIVSLRERGVSAISVNTYLRCFNAFLKWQGSDLKIPRLQEEKKILKTLTEEDVRRVQTHKPKSKSQHRVLSLALLIMDTGLRIAKALALRSTDVDLYNQLLSVTNGKGRKDRVIPFSLAGRKTT